MAIDTIVGQGKFTADGNNKTLKIRSDVDKIVIENYTQWAASNNGYGYKYTWQYGMGTTALMEYHPAADHTSAVDTTASAIEVIDSSDYALGAKIATTAGTDATQPVYDTGDTSGLTTGSIVRLVSTDHNNLNGLDFSIDTVNANVDFRLANTLATVPGQAAGTGHYRHVAPNLEIYNLFAPTNRNLAKIEKTTDTVTTLVDHGYAIGQKVKFKIPSDYGMIELDGLEGNITAITTSTFTVDIDMAAFTTFVFPEYTEVPFDLASVVPVGDAKSSVTELAPSKFYNQGYIGVVLTGGTTSPGGNSDDVIYWTAYKSEFIDN